jgi:hypothetical protein
MPRISGELARSPLMDLTVPAALPADVNASQVVRIQNETVTSSLAVDTQSVRPPVALLGIAWLIDDEQLVS